MGEIPTPPGASPDSHKPRFTERNTWMFHSREEEEGVRERLYKQGMKEREAWLAVRLRVTTAEGEDETAKGAEWLANALQCADAATPDIQVDSQPMNLVDTAVRVLQQQAREQGVRETRGAVAYEPFAGEGERKAA